MIPPDYSVEAQPASEDIANALQILWHPDGGSVAMTHYRREDADRATELLKSALRKLRGAVSPTAPPAEQDTPQ